MDISQLLESSLSEGTSHKSPRKEPKAPSRTVTKSSAAEEHSHLAKMAEEAGLRAEKWESSATNVGIVFGCNITELHDRILNEALSQQVRKNIDIGDWH